MPSKLRRGSAPCSNKGNDNILAAGLITGGLRGRNTKAAPASSHRTC